LLRQVDPPPANPQVKRGSRVIITATQRSQRLNELGPECVILNT
jgi:hypothetical protein